MYLSFYRLHFTVYLNKLLFILIRMKCRWGTTSPIWHQKRTFYIMYIFVPSRTKKDMQRPKPRHSLPGSATTDDLDMFNSTTTIRQAIYNEWRNEKMKMAKQQLAEKKEKEEEEAKKKEKVTLSVEEQIRCVSDDI